MGPYQWESTLPSFSVGWFSSKNLRTSNLKPENHLRAHGHKRGVEGCYDLLVGGFNPFEKYARQIGSFPQVGVKIKNI